MLIILLTGIPGVGKTTIGNYLKNRYDFYHIDLEDPEVNSSKEFIAFHQKDLNPNRLMKIIKKKRKSAVITWGFSPMYHEKLVLQLQKLGATMFWLEGDRKLAKKAWQKRERPIADDAVFDIQIAKIDNHDIQNTFFPIHIDTFDYATKKHRNMEKIIKEIFEKH